ncbi:hypothetical protein [Rhodovibrio salinarum]|uniref:hypothetical protein n=1 Tax=Rhodovibrio salinarum TaxID=1087 RepID=UPI0012DDE54E|nr:hypothetical protein [Rhodovibrio salinarum]
MASPISTVSTDKSGDIKLFLRLIYHNAKLNPLLERGYSYSQVASLLNLAEKEGLITITDGQIALTDRGFNSLNKAALSNLYDKGWIRPLEEEKVEPLGDNELYLPPRSTVRSLRRLGH